MYIKKSPNQFSAPDQQPEAEYSFGNSEPSLLAERLAEPRNLYQIIDDFDSGKTPVRDIADYTSRQRNTMIGLGRMASVQEDWAMPTDPSHLTIIYQACNHFETAMSVGQQDHQPEAGRHFSINMEGFLSAKEPWAVHIDSRIKQIIEEYDNSEVYTRGIDDILAGNNDTNIDQRSRYIWQKVSQRFPLDMAWYLAERSKYSEDWQRSRFNSEMAEGKQIVNSLIQSLGPQYELPEEHIRRALVQLHRSDFSSFDHLLSKKSTKGDYHTRAIHIEGTLRIEVKLDGTIMNPGKPLEPLDAIIHELFHASSAQSQTSAQSWNVGLRSGKVGYDMNEGMTELLKKLSRGHIQKTGDTYEDTEPYIIYPDKESGKLVGIIAYKEQVNSMITLLNSHPHEFSTLFRAYFGFIPDKKELTCAINRFDLYKSHFYDSI